MNVVRLSKEGGGGGGIERGFSYTQISKEKRKGGEEDWRKGRGRKF